METQTPASAVTAGDGTIIRYRTFGGGPKLVLLHGGMQSSLNFRRLAAALQDRFTVYIPDRRGRGLSGPHRPDHGLAIEIADLDALLQETGAGMIFSLANSSASLVSRSSGSPTTPTLGSIVANG